MKYIVDEKISLKKLVLILILQHVLLLAKAQSPQDSSTVIISKIITDTLRIFPTDTTIKKVVSSVADDPNNILTRIEIINNLQRYDEKDLYFNVSTIRTIVQFKKFFSTRLDIPLVYNSFSSVSEYKNYGLGDISIRMLGFNIIQRKKSALTFSVELSFNTATSPILGTGKNLIIPVLSYSKVIKQNKGAFALIVQQTNSMWGDKEREKINFTKIQPILITYWSRKIWTVLAPELYIDYVNLGASMNLQGRLAYAPIKKINVWIQASTGLFGDFVGRYQWSTEVGFRYFLFRKKNDKTAKTGS